jgi:hypothetical protein
MSSPLFLGVRPGIVTARQSLLILREKWHLRGVSPRHTLPHFSRTYGDYEILSGIGGGGLGEGSRRHRIVTTMFFPDHHTSKPKLSERI